MGNNKLRRNVVHIVWYPDLSAECSITLEVWLGDECQTVLVGGATSPALSCLETVARLAYDAHDPAPTLF